MSTTSSPQIDLAPGLSLPVEIVTSTVAILANRGAGKSACAHRLVEQMHFAGLAVTVIDVKGDWWGIRTSADGRSAGLPFVIFGGDHGDVPLEPTAGELLADLIVDDHIPAVLDLSHMSKAKARSFATAFAERLYARNREPLHVVIEEADVLVPQRASADTARLLGAMEDIAKRGRHRGLGLTLVSQRGQEVAKSVLELMETAILLRTTGPRSIKAVQDWISVNADTDDTAVRDVVSSLPSLDVGEAWVWSPVLRLLERIQVPMFTTFDSHATPKPGEVRVTPRGRADIDLAALGAEIAATVERAQENDPRVLRDRLQAMRRQITDAQRVAETATQQSGSYAKRLTEQERLIAELRARITDLEAGQPELSETLTAAANLVQQAIDSIANADRQHAPADTAGTSPPPRPRTVSVVKPPVIDQPDQPDQPEQMRPDPEISTSYNGGVRFRAGAQRMLESLGRMAPLRLTRTQWGTVARMKHSSGTFSTYLSELRRAELIDETTAGFTLTAAGFDYIGGRLDPMTGSELQQHYLTILRSGAGRMLQAIMDAYPNGLTRDEISARAGISATSGTFSTYLSELRRNGLVELRGDTLIASDILMRGAQAQGDR